jgi:hypothetical protein
MERLPMTPLPATPTHKDLGQHVQDLLRRWRAETAPLSSSTRITAHPAYQEIIALGAPALPFLFHDLQQTQDGHLSKALRALTGAQPVPPEDRGQIRKVAEAWLRWARENGYRW